MRKTRSEIISKSVLSYLEGFFTKAINELHEDGVEITPIKEYDYGFKDILAGARELPAILVLEHDRVASDRYVTDCRMLVGLAYKSEDFNQLQEYGAIYEDILEDALRGDPTLGGECLDVNDLMLDANVVSSMYVTFAEFTMSIDWQKLEEERRRGRKEDKSSVSVLSEVPDESTDDEGDSL